MDLRKNTATLVFRSQRGEGGVGVIKVEKT